ncbi:helix-turn-helix domain-containing protein [Dactylosporangium sp. NPDC049525]|uniref:ArsR/SmtB family transcription factor n=1 Tax=Dactylosporangium sp. NPDC049525 TaxID=3154730 RepID=UPI0034336C62
MSVSIGVEGLARLRLAPSPAVEALEWLRLTARGERHRELGDPGPAARFALRDRDVALLGKVVRASSSYTPDLLSPGPKLHSWDGEWQHQLEQVRETPAGVAVDQVLGGQFADLPRDVRDAVDDGTFARRAAVGLRRFYDTALADQITAVRDAIDAELTLRGRLMARHGLGHTLNTLHPSVHWTGTRIELTGSSATTHHLPAAGLVLVPSVLGCPRLATQLDDTPDATVQYPLWGRIAPSARSAGLIDLVGASRAAILRDLDEPRSTTELARRHGLSKSTVSHHLAALFGAGLLVRVRQGKAVHYSRNQAGER